MEYITICNINGVLCIMIEYQMIYSKNRFSDSRLYKTDTCQLKQLNTIDVLKIVWNIVGCLSTYFKHNYSAVNIFVTCSNNAE